MTTIPGPPLTATREEQVRRSGRMVPGPWYVETLRTMLYVAVWGPSLVALRSVFVPGASRDQMITLLAAAIVAIAAVALVVRTARLPNLLVIVAPAAGLAVAVWRAVVTSAAYQLERERVAALAATTGVPARMTPWWELARSSVIDALGSVQEMTRPAPALLGFTIVALLAVGLLSVLGNLLAFDVAAPLEAVAAPTAAMVAATVLSPGRATDRSAAQIAIVTTLLAGLFLLADAGLTRATSRRWVGTGHPGWWRLLAVLASFGLLTGLFSTSAWQAFERDRPDNTGVDAPKRSLRTVSSPLVSVRPRLLNLSNEVMFLMDARDDEGRPVASYWRQAALESFDGSTWSLQAGSYRNLREGDDVPSGGGTVIESATPATVGEDGAPTVPAAPLTELRVHQSLTVVNMRDIWLPVVPRPESPVIIPRGQRLTSDSEAGNILLENATAADQSYAMTSILAPSGAQLTKDPSLRLADATIERLTRIPDDFDPAVASLAQRIVTEAHVDPDDHLAIASTLENYLQASFGYSTSVTPRLTDPLHAFLFEDRKGYCEQFASAFAAMARSLGIPARVAVGFSTGERRSDGVFTVRGANAHAWPEILVAGAGWVAFEPTPGYSLSGVSESFEAAAPTTTTAPTPSSTPTADTVAPATVAPPEVAAPEGLSPVLRWLLVACAAVFAVLAAGLVVLGFTRLRIARRRAVLTRGLDADRAAIEWAWHELVHTLDAEAAQQATSVPPSATPETVLDVAHRVGSAARLDEPDARVVTGVATTLTETRFADPTDDPDKGWAQAVRSARALDRAHRGRLGRGAALRRELGMRPRPRTRATDSTDSSENTGR